MDLIFYERLTKGQSSTMTDSTTGASSSSHNAAEGIARAARQAFEASQLVPVEQRNVALEAIRKVLEENRADVLAANKKDMEVSSPVRVHA
jgi:glutamate-5-semialdehyde dehydrogenase